MVPVTCERCGKQFDNEQGLNIHAGRRHGRKKTARRLGDRSQSQMPAGLDVSDLTIDQLLSLKGVVDGRLAEIGQKIRQAKVGI